MHHSVHVTRLNKALLEPVDGRPMVHIRAAESFLTQFVIKATLISAM